MTTFLRAFGLCCGGLWLLGTLVGCEATQLRYRTNCQAATMTDLNYQQVLDNLAMFEANPASLPYFSVAPTGTTQIQQTGTLSGVFQWDFVSAALGSFLDKKSLTPTANQQNIEGWNTYTTIYPDTLKLMQCAYQKAVGCTFDPKCDCYLQVHFGLMGLPTPQTPVPYLCSPMTADARGSSLPGGQSPPTAVRDDVPAGCPALEQAGVMVASFDSAEPVAQAAPPSPAPAALPTPGPPITNATIQNSNLTNTKIEHATVGGGSGSTGALKPPQSILGLLRKDLYNAIQPGWFECGRLIDVPHTACYVGHYRGKYVWVRPEGMAGLSNFTMAILDIATVQTDFVPKAGGGGAGGGSKGEAPESLYEAVPSRRPFYAPQSVIVPPTP